MYGDGEKLDFGGKHTIVYTDTKFCCTPETCMLLTNVTSLKNSIMVNPS